MAEVVVFERAAASFSAGLAQRGHHIVYRANSHNHCPGCGRSHWYIGRISAECGFCGTAIPLAEAKLDQLGTGRPSAKLSASTEQRLYPRMSATGREVQLVLDDSPMTFALQNISEGGAMGEGAGDLAPGTSVQVRFEGGILVPAVVKWSEDGLVGLAFEVPVMLDRSDKQAN